MADQAREDWGLNFESVGDPHQEISRTCSERGWLTLHTNDIVLQFLQRGANWKLEHPKGFFQPGVLAIDTQKRLLYRWRSVPSVENQHGALARPEPSYVWDAVEESLAAGPSGPDAVLDDDPEIDRPPAPRVMVLAGLIANGWFLSAKSMVYSPGIRMDGSRFLSIYSRWLLFVLFWIVAFSALPTPWAGVGFLGWIAWIVRDYRRYLSGFLSGKGVKRAPD
ncbi:MAG: hypothetical protein AAGA81_12440 [Acidobacteriota bacterium]